MPADTQPSLIYGSSHVKNLYQVYDIALDHPPSCHRSMTRSWSWIRSLSFTKTLVALKTVSALESLRSFFHSHFCVPSFLLLRTEYAYRLCSPVAKTFSKSLKRCIPGPTIQRTSAVSCLGER